MVGELRYAVGGAFDTQLFHSVSQRIRMHTKSLCGAVCTFNHAASLLQYGADMGSFNIFQGFKRSRWRRRLTPAPNCGGTVQ